MHSLEWLRPFPAEESKTWKVRVLTVADYEPVRVRQYRRKLPKQSDEVPIWFWILLVLVLFLFVRYLP